MTLCKDTIEKKFGCKVEDPNANPPILRSNTNPDINGVTHHDSSFCKEVSPPLPQPIANPKPIAEFKNRVNIIEDIHSETLKDEFRKLSSFLWSTKQNKNGQELYYVWTQGENNDDLLQTRKLYNISINDRKNPNFFAKREATIKIIGQKVSGPQQLLTGRNTVLSDNPQVDVDKTTGYELFSSFDKKMREVVKQNQEFIDCVYADFLPFGENDIERFTIQDSNKFKASWSFDYNFYHQRYEEFTQGSGVALLSLPNINFWHSERKNRQDESYVREKSVDKFYNHINLNGKLGVLQQQMSYPTVNFGGVSSNSNWKKFDITQSEQWRYFDLWQNSYQNITTLDRSYQIDVCKNQLQTSNDAVFMQDVGNLSGLFPMIVRMQFPTSQILFRNNDLIKQQNDFLLSLKNSKLDAPLLSHIISSQPTLEPDINLGLDEFQQKEQENIKNQFGEDVGSTLIYNLGNVSSKQARLSFIHNLYENTKTNLNNNDERSVVSRRERKVWDITKWIETFNQFEIGQETLEQQNALQIFDGQETNITTFLGKTPLDFKYVDSKGYEFFKSMMFLLFSSKIKEMMKIRSEGGKARTIDDIFQFGEMCHTEQLLFRISKTRLGEPEQNFYLMNSTEKDVEQWLDSQVKYGEGYTYRVFVYNFVLATSYFYKNFQTYSNAQRQQVSGKFNVGINFDIGAPVAEFEVEYDPLFLLIEQPYFEFSGTMLDGPPIPPEVEFVSYISVDDRIQILFRSNSGQRYEIPITFTEEEELYIESLPSNFRKDDKVLFRNDDLPSAFEIRRQDYKPTNYEDFNVQPYIVSSELNAPSASKMEKQIKNKKYYYLFRTIDRHGHKSNPSDVFQVELVDDGGFVYQEVERVNFEQQNGREQNKVVRDSSYIRIKPSVLQTQIDYENSPGYIDKNGNIASSAKDIIPKIGIADHSIFDRKFKQRVRSKKTGKVIDINFTYKEKRNDENQS